MRKFWRHRKRGTRYEALALATVQASTRPLNDGDTVQVYRGDDGEWHVRAVDEFQDPVRFERLPEEHCMGLTEAEMRALINKPEVDHWLRAVHIEAVHQVDRWGAAHDRAKRPADWFWLVGYLAGKALHAENNAELLAAQVNDGTLSDSECVRDVISGHLEKAKHHTVSTAAALFNWWCAMTGQDVRMAPGSSDLAKIVDGAFPGEVSES